MDKRLTKVKRGIKKRNLHKNTIKLNRQYNNKIIQSGGVVTLAGGIFIAVFVIAIVGSVIAFIVGMSRDDDTPVSAGGGGGGSRQRGGGYLMNLNLMRTNVMFNKLCEKLKFTKNKDLRVLFQEIFDHVQEKYPRLTSLIMAEIKVPEELLRYDKQEKNVRLAILGNEEDELLDDPTGEKRRLRELHEVELNYLKDLTKSGQGYQTVAIINSLFVEANTKLRKQISLYLSLVRLFADIKDNFDVLAYGFYKKPPTARGRLNPFRGSKERERLFLLLKDKVTENIEIRYYKYSEYNKYMYKKGRFKFKNIGAYTTESITINTSSVDIILNKIPDETFGNVKLTGIELTNYDVGDDDVPYTVDSVNLLKFNEWFNLTNFSKLVEPDGSFKVPMNPIDIDKKINILMIEINKLLCVKALAQYDYILENPTVPEDVVNKALDTTDTVIDAVSSNIQHREAEIDRIETSDVQTGELVDVALEDEAVESPGMFSNARKFFSAFGRRGGKHNGVHTQLGSSRPLGSGRSRKHKKYKRKTLKYKNRGFKKNKKTKNRRR